MPHPFRRIAALSLATALAAPANAERVSVLVFDASGSMWNRVEGDLSRIEVARDVMGEYFASRDTGVPLSVIAYGHNRRGDCRDIEVVAPMGQGSPDALERRLRALMPRGMTPLTDSLALARDQIPATAEAADIILVTDGLETCEGDPCALAASLAAEGIEIRAHVVGFGLSRSELEGLSCITDQTGGMMFDTNSGAELAAALQQVSTPEPAPPAPEPEPEPEPAAAFDLGDRAEAGFAYRIRWNGEATNVDYIGFVPQGGTDMTAAISYQPIGGTGTAPTNPVTRTAPTEPGMYDLVLVSARAGIIARQAVEVVAPHLGFEAIGSVEPGARVVFTFRGPERVEERIVIARPGDPPNAQIGDWGYALHKNGTIRLTVPDEPGEYEVRYLNRGRSEVLFARRFGVGIPFVDEDQMRAADLAAAAAAATQADPGQDAIAAIPATFRLPPGTPARAVSWEGIPLDPDMAPEAWAPEETGASVSGLFEPGRWRIIARAPGEVVYQAEVALFPGQSNDVTLTMLDEGSDGALVGGWILWAIPPREIDDQPMRMASFTLRLSDEGQDYIGRIDPGPGMGPAATPEALSSVVLESGDLSIDFPQPGITAEPLRLALSPQGAGFVGTLFAGGERLAVAAWPEDAPQDLALWRDAAFGPAQEPAPQRDIAARCDQPRCEIVVDGLAATLEQGWSMTPPAWVGATAGAHPLDAPRVDFYGPEGASLHLNPHQWLASNGPCFSTEAGALCLFLDAPAAATAAALPLSMSLRLVERSPAPGPTAKDPDRPAAGRRLVPVDLPEGLSPAEVLDRLLPGLTTE
ncbi:vWA domain-containing protein [Pararhodobacter sp.]|uniref:vWA domain-containing protein n=1 Tax=Pararhodobacter sp. TaxID=2127056 RepID=UPI002FDF97D8